MFLFLQAETVTTRRTQGHRTSPAPSSAPRGRSLRTHPRGAPRGGGQREREDAPLENPSRNPLTPPQTTSISP